MAFLKIIESEAYEAEIGETSFTEALSLSGGTNISAEGSIEINQSPSFQFQFGSPATGVLQDLTYSTAIRTDLFNDFAVIYQGGGSAGHETVSIGASSMVITIQSGVSTANQIAASMTANPGFSANFAVTVTGTGSNPQTATALVNIEGGSESDVSINPTNSIESSSAFSPTWIDGQSGQFTTNGTLPAGLSTLTRYFLRQVTPLSPTENSFYVYSSYANFLSNTKVAITNQGSSGSHGTFVPDSFQTGSVIFQLSQDGLDWRDYGASESFTSQFLDYYLEQNDPGAKWVRLKFLAAAGSTYLMNSILTIKGDL